MRLFLSARVVYPKYSQSRSNFVNYDYQFVKHIVELHFGNKPYKWNDMQIPNIYSIDVHRYRGNYIGFLFFGISIAHVYIVRIWDSSALKRLRVFSVKTGIFNWPDVYHIADIVFFIWIKTICTECYLYMLNIIKYTSQLVNSDKSEQNQFKCKNMKLSHM